MKGIVFVEFLEMAEDKFGLELVQQIIDHCDLDSNGIYTSVGTYSHKEFFQILDKITELRHIEKDELLFTFGKYFATVLNRSYPQFFEKDNVIEFLESIDSYIHPTVLKLYPEAELPRFESEIMNNKHIKLTYYSSRKMSKFAKGIILGSGQFFNQDLIVTEEKSFHDGEEVLLNVKYA